MSRANDGARRKTRISILLVAAGLATAAATTADAQSINRYTITGRAAAAAEAQGVPLDKTPRPTPAPDSAAATEGAPGVAEAAPPKPRVERYGLFGMSWRSR